jgi:hypothetical protein
LLASAAPPAKLRLVREALALHELGPYEPIDTGPSVCAFRRGEDVVVAAVVHGSGGTVRLPPGSWRDRLTGAAVKDEVEVGDSPIALIQRSTS